MSRITTLFISFSNGNSTSEDNDLILYDTWSNYECHSNFGNEKSHYENNGITINEFCGGIKDNDDADRNYFIPIEIEVFEIIPNGKEYPSKIITTLTMLI